MPYEAEISRTQRAYVVLLIDQSGSMETPFFGGDRPKSEEVADALNRLVHELVQRAAQEDPSKIKNLYDISIIGYNDTVRSLFCGALADKDMVTISELRDHPARIEERTQMRPDNAGGVVPVPVRFPVWVETDALGLTDMSAALDYAHDLVSEWVSQNTRSFPPIVINLTDGLATGESPVAAATRLRSLATQDGQVLLFNAHVTADRHEPMLYPENHDTLPPEGQLLFQMSSELPDRVREIAGSLGVRARYGSRGLVFNGNVVDVINLLDIGTRFVPPAAGAHAR
ncbi:VWA domain-containing protein [Streptomyces sp. J2-1]|uniref:vWA domain-containing protein n=1 Tax=Streptomyces corallincola TaxID=2851888 RepID=UPI001C380C63|nr:vWA domain-containing protein [Streptomyces corallincola]MBV2355553.1 VWA domain-containing protein [Streptomyces corallincola]